MMLSATHQPTRTKKRSYHDYRPVEAEFQEMTTAQLFDEGHIAIGNYPYDHKGFVAEAEEFNGKGL